MIQNAMEKKNIWFPPFDQDFIAKKSPTIRTPNTNAKNPHMYSDKNQYNQLIAEGVKYLQSDNINKLREIYGQLISIKIYSNDNFMDEVNILRG